MDYRVACVKDTDQITLTVKGIVSRGWFAAKEATLCFDRGRLYQLLKKNPHQQTFDIAPGYAIEREMLIQVTKAHRTHAEMEGKEDGNRFVITSMARMIVKNLLDSSAVSEDRFRRSARKNGTPVQRGQAHEVFKNRDRENLDRRRTRSQYIAEQERRKERLRGQNHLDYNHDNWYRDN